MVSTPTGFLILAMATGAQAGNARLPDGFWLLGDFTQNVRCKGNGCDPAEVKVKVATTRLSRTAHKELPEFRSDYNCTEFGPFSMKRESWRIQFCHSQA
jgi:hypothetical protein